MPEAVRVHLLMECPCLLHIGASGGNVPGAVEILGGGLIAPEVILGAVKDKSRHEEDCHKSHQKNQ